MGAMGAELLHDLKYALRSFARRPLFTAVLVLTLALGIGSNVAIFSVANAVLFRPLPYEEPEELALIWTRLPDTNVARSLVSGPDFGDYRDQTTVFEGLAGGMAVTGTLTGDGDVPAEQIVMAMTTPNFFELLGVTPFIGRTIDEGDAFEMDPQAFGQPNPDLPPGTVMLSHSLWQSRFAGDRDIVGRTIQLDGWGSVVVGVLPADFRIYLPPDTPMPTDIDVWGVLPTNVPDFARDAPWLTVVGRIRDGASMEQAQTELDGVASRLRDTYQFHANSNMQVVVNGMHEDVVSHARPSLLALLGAVAFVLLIACANVANLLLVRATSRGREIAVRAALGSGRGRIIRQMLTESGLLAAIGAVVGVLLAWWGTRVIIALSPGNLPRVENIRIDGQVLLFTAGVAAVAALAFGLAPAMRAVSGKLADALKDRGSESGGLRGNRLRTALVVTEVALSMVLLIGAGLMVRSFAEIRRVEPGFDPEGVATFELPLPFLRYFQPDVRAGFVNDLRDRLLTIPGVESVGGVTPLPLTGGELYSMGRFGLVGGSPEDYEMNRADYRSVLPGFFEAMGIELVAGRTLLSSDNRAGALPVAVIDEALAERAFGDQDPIGRELMWDYFSETTFSIEPRAIQVVGVVENIRSASLSAAGRETLYMPYYLYSFLPLTFTVRTATDPASLVPLIRREVDAMDPGVPVAGASTLQSYVDDAMAPTRFMLALIGVFAALALVLASLGLYGVISYSVRQRTREIGVRMAFGAREGDVLKLVLAQGVVLAGSGIALGLIASVPLSGVVRSFLVGVSPTDPLTFVGIPLVLLGVAVLASYLPARRAATVDPVEALRDD
jgi:putative ABC transport system permease protein